MPKELQDVDARLCRFLHCKHDATLTASELHCCPCIVSEGDMPDHSDREIQVSADMIDIAAIILVVEGLAADVVEAELTERGAKRPIHIVNNIWSAFVCPVHLDSLRELELVRFIEGPRQVSPNLADTAQPIGAVQDRIAGPGEELDGQDVVIGIVDYGIDWTLPDFCDADDHTRVKYLWDQSRPADAENGEKPPAPYGYGAEYAEDDINRALSEFRAGGLLNVSPVRHRPWPESPEDATDMVGHGTRVAGIATGNGAGHDPQEVDQNSETVGVAPNSSIVFVHLDRRAIRDQTGSREGTLVDSVQLLEAVHYCFSKADELAEMKGKPVPCVVNLSLGFNGGSHDGASALEWAIDGLLEKPGRAVTVAAGNRRGAMLDYFDTVRSQEPYSLAWRIVAGGSGSGKDTSANELEIWYSSEETLAFRLEDGNGAVVPPEGESLHPDGELKTYDVPDVARVHIQSSGSTFYNGDAQIYLRIEPLSAESPIPKRTWRIILESVNGGDVDFHAWIEKEVIINTGEGPLPRNRPRLSLFNPQTRMDDETRPFVTVTSPGTCRSAITVGAYNTSSGKLYSKTSEGPIRDPAIKKPEVVAPGVNILSNNVIFDRNDPGVPRFVARSGTSLAAPYVAGVLALMFQLDPYLSADEIRDILIHTADNQSGGDFHPRWGFGIIDPQQALEEVNRRR